MAGQTLDVIALREGTDGCVPRPLYDFMGAVDAVCQTSSASRGQTDAWLQPGKWNTRCPDVVRKCTYELPRKGKGSNAPKSRVIDLFGIEELVRKLDCASIDTFRQNHGFVECAEEAGSKRSRAHYDAAFRGATGSAGGAPAPRDLQTETAVQMACEALETAVKAGFCKKRLRAAVHRQRISSDTRAALFEAILVSGPDIQGQRAHRVAPRAHRIAPMDRGKETGKETSLPKH